MDKDLEKCGCNGEEENCGCGGHGNGEECGCGCHDEDEVSVIDLEDENGNVITCPIVDEFEFEEKQYFLAQNPEEDSVYLFRLDGEELIVPDEEEFNRASAYYENDLEGEE